MATIAATTAELARLLALFPVDSLKHHWPDLAHLNKVAFCEAVAELRPGDIATFVAATFGICKQHIYLFDKGDAKAFPKAPAGAQLVVSGSKSAMYLVSCVASVVLTEPAEQSEITFLWPVRVDFVGSHVAVRFVLLAKDVPSYFKRKAVVTGFSHTEEGLMRDLAATMGITALDVHKGMKALWKGGFMDCHYTRYRKAKSAATEVVDRTEKKGIRENDPTLFALLMNSAMRESVFTIEATDVGVKKVGIDPSIGRLAFQQYADHAQAIDNVVRQILQSNK